MMSRLTFLFFFCTIGMLFQNIETKASDVVMSDSLRVRWIDGKKFLLHKVEPKQTWSSLAKKYNCTVTDLKDANNGVEDLKIGQIINVPVITATENKSETGTKNTEKKPDLKESPKNRECPGQESFQRENLCLPYCETRRNTIQHF